MAGQPFLACDLGDGPSGSRVEILLTSGRVLFRSLDFPKQRDFSMA